MVQIRDKFFLYMDPVLWESFKVTVPSVGYFETDCQCRTPICQRLSKVFFLLHTAVGNGAMNKFEICLQRHKEHFKPRMLLFSVGKCAMSVPQYWQQRNKLLLDVGNCIMMPVAGLDRPGQALLRQVWIHWQLYKEHGETQFSLWKIWYKCRMSLQRNEFYSRFCNPFPNC